MQLRSTWIIAVATIPVVDNRMYNVGDRISFTNTTGTPLGAVRAVGLADKTDTGHTMTFVVVSKPATGSDDDGRSTLSPIAWTTPELDAEQLAVANV